VEFRKKKETEAKILSGEEKIQKKNKGGKRKDSKSESGGE